MTPTRRHPPALHFCTRRLHEAQHGPQGGRRARGRLARSRRLLQQQHVQRVFGRPGEQRSCGAAARPRRAAPPHPPRQNARTRPWSSAPCCRRPATSPSSAHRSSPASRRPSTRSTRLAASTAPPMTKIQRRLGRHHDRHRVADRRLAPLAGRRRHHRRGLLGRLADGHRQDHVQRRAPDVAGQHLARTDHLRGQRPVLARRSVRCPPGRGHRGQRDRRRPHQDGRHRPSGPVRPGP